MTLTSRPLSPFAELKATMEKAQAISPFQSKYPHALR